MSIRKVLRMGEPSLREVSLPVVDFEDPQLRALLKDMHDTMHAERGAGLAAPQIGVNLRVVIFGFESNQRYPDAPSVPETILINPQIEILTEQQEDGWEGCLSVPGMRGIVPRFSSIRYRGQDASGTHFETIAHGFHARVVQHECDHLDGILYPQRMQRMETLGFLAELEASGVFSRQPCDD